MKLLKYSCYLGLWFISYSCGTVKSGKNSSENKSDQRPLTSISQDNVKSSIIEKNRKQLELNYTEELRHAEIKGDKEAIAEINSKYRVLKNMFDEESREFSQTKSSDQFAIEGDIDFDQPYAWPFDSVYHPLVQREVQKVYQDFGHLYISETVTSSGRVTGEEVRAPKPWSAYWYPFRDRRLYNNDDSVLVKYDRMIAAAGGRSKIADAEKETYGFYNADGWEGLCDAWALASVTTSEPTIAKKLYGINFSISDQKALAIFSHSKYPYKQYGITYRGDADTDGTYQDLKPEAFHQIVVSVIGREKRALIIDETPGVEVWNKPLYRYRWQITKDPKVPSAYIVKAFPWLINQRTFVSDTLTNIDDTIAPIYEYRLYVDKNTVRQGKYLVVAGQWIKNSRKYHPGNVKYPLMQAELKSHNKEFNKYIPIYQKLF